MGRENPGAAGPDFDPAELRKRWHGVLVTNAGYDKASANAALAAGAADPKTFYRGGERGYLDYPALGAR
jgi:N-ethylmaleimide reductase